MKFYDFDELTQKYFNTSFSSIPSINWRNWLSISSKEEYEDVSLKNSGLSNENVLFEKIKAQITESKDISIDKDEFIRSKKLSNPLFLCHSSGTSGGTISDLKWLYMSDKLIKTIWAPGMEAIFETSGLNSSSSAVIFIPTRTINDGFKKINDLNIISLYSSEFSQRLVLSLLKPKSYLIDQYKNSKNPFIIEKILALEDISIISAPASTILSWADLHKFKEGVEKFLQYNSNNPELNESKFFKKINKIGINKTLKEIQKRLSQKLSKATLIFSISSLTDTEWNKIRNFMGWQKNKENFTNLYVASEIGPFAATLRESIIEISPKDKMFVFPLTIPVVEKNGKRDLISRADFSIGKLLISRLSENEPHINIKTGDIVTIKNQDGLPQIGGDILRGEFQLKRKFMISPELNINYRYRVLVGDYFKFKNFEIINPRRLFACLSEKCNYKRNSVVIISDEEKKSEIQMLIPIFDKNKNLIYEKIVQYLSICPYGREIKAAIENGNLNLKLVDKMPLQTESTRYDLLRRVRDGKVPKGVLKKWPIYIISS